MALFTKIKDGGGNGHEVKVTSRGELIVNRLDYSTAYNTTADVINTAYNLVTPISGSRFIITGIFLYANKNVGVNDATVVLYEADSATTTTVSSTIFTAEMVKQTARDFTGLNIIINEGKWLNIKTDDDDIFATILGYYVDA